MVFREIVGFIVHAENNRVIRIGGWSRNDHFLHGAANVLARVGALCEESGRLDDDARADRSPVEFARILDLEYLESLAID
jgi:hypothetical protein